MNQFEMHWRVFLYLKCIVSYTIYDSKMPCLFDQWVSSLVLKCFPPHHVFLLCIATLRTFVLAFVLWLQLETLISLVVSIVFRLWVEWCQDQMYIISIFIFLKYRSYQCKPIFPTYHCNFLLVLLHSPPLWPYRQNSIQCLWFT